MAKKAKTSLKHANRAKPRKVAKPRKSRQPSLLASWLGSISPESRRTILVGATWVVVILAVLAGAVWGLHKAEQRAFGNDRNGQVAECPEVVLVDAPAWMPTMVSGRIRQYCRPFGIGFYDDEMLTEVARRAASIPWVRRVNYVRKRLAPDGRSGVIELSCEYREAVVRVELDNRFGRESQRVAYVDARGVRLPYGDVPKYLARYTSMDGAFVERAYASSDGPPPHSAVWDVHYPTVRGVMSEAPPAGQVWHSPELAAGLRLYDLIATRRYKDQITVIDVRNYDGRLDPDGAHLRMHAQIGTGRPTTIVFGRFPMPDGGDYVVSPERKLGYLDWYTQETNGALAGLHERLDLRYDQIHAE